MSRYLLDTGIAQDFINQRNSIRERVGEVRNKGGPDRHLISLKRDIPLTARAEDGQGSGTGPMAPPAGSPPRDGFVMWHAPVFPSPQGRSRTRRRISSGERPPSSRARARDRSIKAMKSGFVLSATVSISVSVRGSSTAVGTP
jgi:hypothetical protein